MCWGLQLRLSMLLALRSRHAAVHRCGARAHLLRLHACLPGREGMVS
jgi:hypothetical protein